MCLTTIDKKPPKPSGIGYKVVDRDENDTSIFYCDLYSKRVKREIGKTYRAKRAKIGVDDYDETYISGFHIYVSRAEAKNECMSYNVLVKVKYYKAHTSGKQFGARVVVSDDMTIIEEIKLP